MRPSAAHGHPEAGCCPRRRRRPFPGGVSSTKASRSLHTATDTRAAGTVGHLAGGPARCRPGRVLSSMPKKEASGSKVMASP